MIAQILPLLRINEETFSAFYFESAGVFLDRYYQDPELTLMLMQSNAFWQWYSQQFDDIDRVFVEQFKSHSAHSENLRLTWKAAHHPERLIAYPGQHIIEKALGCVIGQMWKEEHRLNHLKTVSHG